MLAYGSSEQKYSFKTMLKKESFGIDNGIILKWICLGLEIAISQACVKDIRTLAE